MEIPAVAAKIAATGIATAPIQSGRQLNDDSEGEDLA